MRESAFRWLEITPAATQKQCGGKKSGNFILIFTENLRLYRERENEYVLDS